MARKMYVLGMLGVLLLGMVLVSCKGNGLGGGDGDGNGNGDGSGDTHGLSTSNWPEDEPGVKYYYKKSNDGQAIAINVFVRGDGKGKWIPDIFEVQSQGKGAFPIGTWNSNSVDNEWIVFGDTQMTIVQGGTDTNYYYTFDDDYIYVSSTPGGTPGGGGGLEADIDTNLVGSWRDTINGSTLTVTFQSNGTVTWGGTAGNSLNLATSAFQGSGYTFVWIATSGVIKYKYIGPYATSATEQSVYGYHINGSGQLELTIPSQSTAWVTLEKYNP